MKSRLRSRVQPVCLSEWRWHRNPTGGGDCKRLSDKAYLVYEQGVDAASAAVKLTYTISRQWSVVAKAGQEIDLFWNIWFD